MDTVTDKFIHSSAKFSASLYNTTCLYCDVPCLTRQRQQREKQHWYIFVVHLVNDLKHQHLLIWNISMCEEVCQHFDFWTLWVLCFEWSTGWGPRPQCRTAYSIWEYTILRRSGIVANKSKCQKWLSQSKSAIQQLWQTRFFNSFWRYNY